MRLEYPEGKDMLTEFILFYDRVYGYRSVRWPANIEMQMPLLTGQSVDCEDRIFRPLLVRDEGEIVARAVAVVDDRYNRHWNERLGHIIMFEAMPNSRDAVKLLMDTACDWLKSKGTEAARAGFGVGFHDFPFVIDEYEALLPAVVRQNPAYYHSLLKDAGFESEKGCVDYKMKVTPKLSERYASALEAARRSGFEIVPLNAIPESRRVREFNDIFNDAFRYHWGLAPMTDAQWTEAFGHFAQFGILDTSVLAYQGSDPIGMLLVLSDLTAGAVATAPRTIQESEKLNILGIGVRSTHRGKGVNLGMASHAYLELIRRGATWLSYTIVLDDNWPSRRTAEKLGAHVCANYLVYRRNFRS
jgi:GNAT superfamily N-acetyltransferase